MKTINYKFYNKLNIKTFKRYINNVYLIATLKDISQNRKFNIEGNSNTKINDVLDKIQLESFIIKENHIIYDNILQNLKESEIMLNTVRTELTLAKKKSINISLEFQENKTDLNNIKLDTLNNNVKNTREILNDNTNINLQNKIISSDIDQMDSNIQKLKSNNLFDFEWLNVIVDFMKSNSSLILTISNGLIIGGMWYVNSRGLDIGAMLGRLGLNIYSNLSGSNSNISNTNLELPLSSTTHNHQGAATAKGFFRQLGTKILEIIDIYIEKMKDKRQKYM